MYSITLSITPHQIKTEKTIEKIILNASERSLTVYISNTILVGIWVLGRTLILERVTLE
jgi:hypothetical protein